MSLRHRVIALLLVSGLFLLASCGSDSCTDVGGCKCGGESDPHPRASIEGLIEYFAASMEARDIETYSDCLTQGYRFEFDPGDYEAAGVTPGEPWWGRVDDLKSMGSLFASPEILSIEAGFPIESSGYVGDVYTVKCSGDIRLPVDDPEADGGFVYRVHASWFYFKIGPDESEPGLFRIVEMREETRFGAASGEVMLIEPSTLGNIKTMFK